MAEASETAVARCVGSFLDAGAAGTSATTSALLPRIAAAAMDQAESARGSVAEVQVGMNRLARSSRSRRDRRLQRAPYHASQKRGKATSATRMVATAAPTATVSTPAAAVTMPVAAAAAATTASPAARAAAD